jgi:hypothetical protein
MRARVPVICGNYAGGWAYRWFRIQLGIGGKLADQPPEEQRSQPGVGKVLTIEI